MKYVSVLLAVSCLLSAVQAQWPVTSSPVLVDGAFNARGAGRLGHDVTAIDIESPTGGEDTFAWIYPAGVVGNKGDGVEAFWSFYTIFDTGGNSVYVDSLQHFLGAGETEHTFYDSVRLTVVGDYVAVESVYLAADEDSTNDVCRLDFSVDGDSGSLFCVLTHLPSDTLDTLAEFQPWFVMKNTGLARDSGSSFVGFSDLSTEHVVYDESVRFLVDAGAESTVYFPVVRLQTPGEYRGMFVMVLRWYTYFCPLHFWVVPEIGIEESPRPQASSARPTATVVRGLLWLPEARVESRESRGELLDISGQKVMKLRPGPNDVSKLSPGVYFVREEPQASSHKPQAARKVVVQR
jgi:hypothetical protein